MPEISVSNRGRRLECLRKSGQRFRDRCSPSRSERIARVGAAEPVMEMRVCDGVETLQYDQRWLPDGRVRKMSDEWRAVWFPLPAPPCPSQLPGQVPDWISSFPGIGTGTVSPFRQTADADSARAGIPRAGLRLR